MIDLAANHLAFAPLLQARLAAVDELDAVGGAMELDVALRDGVTAPAAFVVFGGTDTVTTPGGATRRPRVISQTWEVDLLLPIDFTALDRMAVLGALLAAVMDVLEGWRPEGAINELQPIPIEEPVIYAGGLVRFVLAYRIDLNLT